jgi:type IV secretory pathway TrbL component
MNNLTKVNELLLQNLHIKGIDYPSALIMLLFTSGTFFIAISILFPSMNLAIIFFAQILIIFITMTNFSTKITSFYSKLVIFLKRKLK